jgi:hypothetical protein
LSIARRNPILNRVFLEGHQGERDFIMIKNQILEGGSEDKCEKSILIARLRAS